MSARGQDDPDAGAFVLRFDAVERTLHWSNALWFFLLATTGAIIFFPDLSVLVGRRDVVRLVHNIAGFSVVVIPVFVLTGGLMAGGLSRLGQDVRMIDGFTEEDRRWLAGAWRFKLSRNSESAPPQGKFNAGQKLNAIFTAAATVVLFGTGAIMFWNRSFPLWLKQGAVLVHDSTAVVLVLVVIGHVAVAVRDGAAMRGMVTGSVPKVWARRHHPRWVSSSERRFGR